MKEKRREERLKKRKREKERERESVCVCVCVCVRVRVRVRVRVSEITYLLQLDVLNEDVLEVAHLLLVIPLQVRMRRVGEAPVCCINVLPQ